MEKKKGFQMPHTYIIIFGVILFAALLTVFIPLGKYDTKEITYMQNGVEKTRTVLDPESFQYILDENGNKVTKAAPIFGTEDFGGQGILNYVFEGMTVGDKNGTAVGIIAFILVVGGRSPDRRDRKRHYAGHRFDKWTRDPSDPDPRSPVLPRRRSLRYG